MDYTVRFAHLQDPSLYDVGEIITTGQFVGMAGNTGASEGRHLHIDCVSGIINHNWKLSESENGKPESSPRQLNYFIDNTLFKSEICITTQYCDVAYQLGTNKVHHAYDVVPMNRKDWGIYWNRSHPGMVVFSGFDNAYGNTILISFTI